MTAKILALMMLYCLTSIREISLCEQHAGFRQDRGCVVQMFTLRQLLETRHAHGSTMLFLPDFKDLFDLVLVTPLFSTVYLNGMT